MEELNNLLIAKKVIPENVMYELIECEPANLVEKLSKEVWESGKIKNSLKKEEKKGTDEGREELYKAVKAEADEFFASEQYDKAEETYQKALNLKPSPFIKGRINECKNRQK